jgi:hypothetical protein
VLGEAVNLFIEQPTESRRKFKLTRRLAGWLIAVGGMAYMAVHMRGAADALDKVTLQPGWMTLAVLCIAAGQALNGIITHRLLRSLAGGVDWPDVLRVHLMSQIAKYLPAGGVLNVTAQTVALSRLPGVGVTVAVWSVALMVVLVCAGAACFQGLSQLISGAGISWPAVLSVLCLPVTALATAYPAWLSRLGGRTLARFVPQLDNQMPANPAWLVLRAAGLVGLALLGWLIMGLGAVCVAVQGGQLTVVAAVQLGGAFAFSWLVGFLALVAPGGLGVREVSLMLMLKPLLPPPWPAIFPLISRLTWVVADVLCFLIGWACLGASGSSRRW